MWKDKPFSRGQAWIDLILMANHTQTKFPLGSEMVEVERGSFITSELKLMDRWGWSKTKVRSFLELLQNDSMLIKKTDQKKTTLTITNYSVWQDSETIEKPKKDHKKTDERPKKNTNKNEKNDNNEKNEEDLYIPYQEIINYLNLKANTQYKHTVQKNRTTIHARWMEGFREQDFYKVIDNKVTEWLNDIKMNKYLRPETLFGTKFEGYLNSKVVNNGQHSGDNQQNQAGEYDLSKLMYNGAGTLPDGDLGF